MFLLTVVERFFDLEAGELGRHALAWARLVPTVLLVPAFGLRAMAMPVRFALGFMLALAAVPAEPVATGSTAWLVELARGLPVAVAAATALWTMTMIGAVFDDLRGRLDACTLGPSGAESGPFGSLLALLAAIAFLETGGPGRVCRALFPSEPALRGELLTRVAANLASGIGVAVAVAAPVLVASALLEASMALWSRAGGGAGASVPFLASPLRVLALLVFIVLIFEQVAEVVVRHVAAVP